MIVLSFWGKRMKTLKHLTWEGNSCIRESDFAYTSLLSVIQSPMCLPFFYCVFLLAAPLQCICSLISWVRCSDHHLQYHPNTAPEARKLFWSCTEIIPAVNKSGSCLAPESGSNIPSHSCQISLQLQPKRFLQCLPSK